MLSVVTKVASIKILFCPSRVSNYVVRDEYRYHCVVSDVYRDLCIVCGEYENLVLSVDYSVLRL